MTQQIEESLAQEFQEEMNKIKDFDISKLELSPENNKVLDNFFKKYLDPKEDFPEGARHSILEKNFAIYVVKNKIPQEQIEEAYKSKGFNIQSLKSQINGVLNGTYSEKPNVSIGELVNWCKEFRPDLKEMFIDEDFKATEKVTNVTKKERPASDFNLLWEKDLENYKEKHVNWIVERFIKSGNIVIIAGKRAVTKSWLSMNLCYCVSEGLTFLQKFQCEKGNVLYLDRENGFSELKKRNSMIKKGLELEGSEGLAFLSETTLKLDNFPDVAQIEQFINENQIRLIVADTYRRLISFKEDSADAVSEFFVDVLKPLCERTGVSIVLIHHEKKGESSGDDMDMLRGSSDLANYVDAIVQLERKGDYITIKQTKQRGAKELEPFQAKIETDELNYFKYNYTGQPQSKELQIEKLLVRWILEKRKTQFTYTEARTFCESQGFKKQSITNALNSMRSRGIVTKGENTRDPYIPCFDLNLEVFE